jgi:hypothetical protein
MKENKMKQNKGIDAKSAKRDYTDITGIIVPNSHL